MISRGRGAEAAGIDFGAVVADGAEYDALLNFKHRRSKPLDIRLGHAQDVKRQPLRRLLADARQAFEFVDQFSDWFSVFQHKEVSSFRFMRPQVQSFPLETLGLKPET